MHLLGHGIVGTLIEEIKKVMTHHGLWTTFIEFVNPMLEDIASFRLDWCKVKTLPKANWLGEDCFGFARLMYYLFIQFTKKYDIATHRVDTTMEQVIALTQVLHSFTAMVYSVMCKDKTHKKRYGILIRIFLTCCSRFCKVYYNGSVKEFWSNKQNFPSLLNLPDQIEKFGHLGLSWDATFEACLGGIKDLLKSARKNPESLLPRMVLLQKKQHIDILREI